MKKAVSKYTMSFRMLLHYSGVQPTRPGEKSVCKHERIAVVYICTQRPKPKNQDFFPHFIPVPLPEKGCAMPAQLRGTCREFKITSFDVRCCG